MIQSETLLIHEWAETTCGVASSLGAASSRSKL